MMSGVGLRNRVLDKHAHWCHLANTVKRLRVAATSGFATRDGDEACSQITLSNLVIRLRSGSDV